MQILIWKYTVSPAKQVGQNAGENHVLLLMYVATYVRNYEM